MEFTKLSAVNAPQGLTGPSQCLTVGSKLCSFISTLGFLQNVDFSIGLKKIKFTLTRK